MSTTFFGKINLQIGCFDFRRFTRFYARFLKTDFTFFSCTFSGFSVKSGQELIIHAKTDVPGAQVRAGL
jgi:hypothetical protein